MSAGDLALARAFLLAPENFAEVRGGHELTVRLAAIDEYLASAAADTRAPVPWFDAAFYLAFRAEREALHPNPYLDFVLSGRFRGYYPNATLQDRDARLLARLHPAGAALYGSATEEKNPAKVARHFLRQGFHEGRTWIADFDRAFVEKNYPEYVETSVNSCVYAATVLNRPWLFLNERQASDEVGVLWASDHFDEAFYRAQLGPYDGNARLHYLTQGARALLDPSREFSTSSYLAMYPDTAASQMNALVQYESAGRAQGRKLASEVSLDRRSGARAWDPAKPTVIVASHEGSRTGAPIVSLRLAAQLAERYNVIIWLGRDGTLEPQFLAHCVTLLVGFPPLPELRTIARNLLRDTPVDFVVLNSVETYPILAALSDEEVGIVSLVHEFAEYTRPCGRLSRMVAYSQYAVMPATIVKESCEREFAKHLLPPPTNIVIRPQGGDEAALRSLPDAASVERLRQEVLRGRRSKIVFGAGYVQPRKGVDHFIDVARRVVLDHGDDAVFVWVGTNYLPDTDVTYGIWLREQIRRSGIEDRVVMMPEQEDLELFWAITDVFLLPSRLDPFPNVGLDAIAHGKPLVCFEDATGIAELAGEPAFGVTSVRYADTVEAAKAVSAELRHPRPPQPASERVAALLSFPAYARDVENLGLEAKQRVAEFRRDIREHVAARLFEPSFFEAGFPPWLRHQRNERATAKVSALRYQRLVSAGVYAAKPRPGLNDAVVASERSTERPYRGVFAAEPCANTNEVLGLQRRSEPTERDGQLSSLLHLHLYNVDNASELASRLAASGLQSDLVITTDTDDKQAALAAAFAGATKGKVLLEKLPNRGRNIGPLLHVLATRGDDYDLVCHVHSKSSTALSKASVEAWSAFVLEHLLPDANDMQQIMGAFLDDPELGLLFADDPSIIGWTANRTFAEGLARKLEWATRIPAQPEFPIGAMFWARTAALKPLLRPGLSLEDLPDEPVPYDGSTLHAIERLFPTACTEAGFRWKTLHRKNLRRHA